jgi:hypothetical protein
VSLVKACLSSLFVSFFRLVACTIGNLFTCVACHLYFNLLIISYDLQLAMVFSDDDNLIAQFCEEEDDAHPTMMETMMMSFQFLCLPTWIMRGARSVVVQFWDVR